MKNYKIMRNEKGITLVVALLILAALTLLGTAAIFATTTDLRISSNFRQAGETFYAAEAGAEYGVNRLRAALKIIGGDTSSVIPPTINGFIFENAGAFLATNGVTTQTVLPSASAFAGLTSFSKRYTITSTARKNNTNSRTTLIYEVEDQLIPLFQFGIFYDDRLELQPGANMNFTRGRIHSNGDIYLQTSATLTIDTRVTAAGNIYNKRGDSGVVTGNDTVKIKGADGNFHGLNFGSNSSSWKSDATSTWGERYSQAIMALTILACRYPQAQIPSTSLAPPMTAASINNRGCALSMVLPMTRMPVSEILREEARKRIQ